MSYKVRGRKHENVAANDRAKPYNSKKNSTKPHFKTGYKASPIDLNDEIEVSNVDMHDLPSLASYPHSHSVFNHKSECCYVLDDYSRVWNSYLCNWKTGPKNLG